MLRKSNSLRRKVTSRSSTTTESRSNWNSIIEGWKVDTEQIKRTFTVFDKRHYSEVKASLVNNPIPKLLESLFVAKQNYLRRQEQPILASQVAITELLISALEKKGTETQRKLFTEILNCHTMVDVARVFEIMHPRNGL